MTAAVTAHLHISMQAAARALGGKTEGPNSVRCPGPGHSAKDNSLVVTFDPSAPGGFIVYSHANDDPFACKDYVRERLGLPQPDFSRSATTANIVERMSRTAHKAQASEPAAERMVNAPRKLVAEYIYRAADGSPYLKVDRFEPKTFRQSRWTGAEWEPKAPIGPKIPYRLPDMLNAVHDTVLFVEGEKDADALAARGFVATTNSGGSSGWTDDLATHFAGKTVHIIPDNDEAGRKWADRVCKSLNGVARELRVVHLPGLPEKGDVSDWLAAGGDTGELVPMCMATPVYTPGDAVSAAPAIVAQPFRWIDPSNIPPRERIYGKHYVRKYVSVTVAIGGVGKSTLSQVEAMAIATNRPLLGVQPAESCPVWIINLEDPQDELDRRTAAIAMHYGINPSELEGRLFLNTGRKARMVVATQTRDGVTVSVPIVSSLKDQIRKHAIGVLVIDPLVHSHQVPENDNGNMAAVMDLWRDIADECCCSIDLLHHPRKTGGAEVTEEDGRGGSAIHGAARSLRVLNRMTKDEGERAGVENHKLHFKVGDGKQNLSPPAAEDTWYKLVGCDLGNATARYPSDHVAVVTTWAWPNALDGLSVADLRQVQKAVAAGNWRDDHQARDWVGKAVADVLGLDIDDKADKNRIKSLLKTWKASGALKVVERPDAKRMPRPFVVVGDHV